MKKLTFCVTNDLLYDQRMHRICGSLADNSFEVTLVGRKGRNSGPIVPANYKQVRLHCIFNKGFLFYAEYNVRLFVFLLFRKSDLLCAIDLDTILAVLFASKLKGIRRVYDAHELFCEMKEIVTRPKIYRVWKIIEEFAVPKFKYGYTVNHPLADEFRRMYGSEFLVIRNVPRLKAKLHRDIIGDYVLYQGAVNEGRSFETLIPAFHHIEARLIICGDGNFLKQAKTIVMNEKLSDKVSFTGKLLPAELQQYTKAAKLGVTLFDAAGLSNYYSLANRFFDYMHAGVPQICVDFPVYRDIVKEFPFALLIRDISPKSIAHNINRLLKDEKLYEELTRNCLIARQQLNWQKEEMLLNTFYRRMFESGE